MLKLLKYIRKNFNNNKKKYTCHLYLKYKWFIFVLFSRLLIFYLVYIVSTDEKNTIFLPVIFDPL